MNDNQPQNIDVIALVGQLDALKKQRSNAMDDVALLFGKVTSLEKQLEMILAKQNEEKQAPDNDIGVIQGKDTPQ